MELPEAFLIRFFTARNALLRREQKELEAFQREFCQGALIYDKRLVGYEEERILEVARQGAKVNVTTNGNSKGLHASRLRYELAEGNGTWLISDLWIECVIAMGVVSPNALDRLVMLSA